MFLVARWNISYVLIILFRKNAFSLRIRRGRWHKLLVRAGRGTFLLMLCKPSPHLLTFWNLTFWHEKLIFFRKWAGSGVLWKDAYRLSPVLSSQCRSLGCYFTARPHSSLVCTTQLNLIIACVSGAGLFYYKRENDLSRPFSLIYYYYCYYYSFSPEQAQSSASKLDEIQAVRERLLKLTIRFSHCIKESCVVNREVNEALRLRVFVLFLGSLKLTTQSGKFIGRFAIHRTFYNMASLTKLGDRAEILKVEQ